MAKLSTQNDFIFPLLVCVCDAYVMAILIVHAVQSYCFVKELSSCPLKSFNLFLIIAEPLRLLFYLSL